MKKTTAAQQYAQAKTQQFEAFLDQSFSKEALKGVSLFEVKCPSGFSFKCRKLDASFAANAGQMPMALTAQLLAGTQTDLDDDAKAQAFNSMTPAEQRASIQVAAQMVRYVAVEPRIVVGNVGDRTDAVSSDSLTMADFNALVTWAQGGDEGKALRTFRGRRK